YPGHYGMVVLSRYPIRDDLVRTFSTMRWIDLPGATLPDDPATAAATDWYDDAARSVLRLSSKGHWDVPIDVDGVLVHLLVSHPTPPVFDGPEDRNGRRNHDEIGFWAAYLDPARASALVDDAGRSGGLAPGAPFVILGDLNADPHDGESRPGAAAQVLECARVRSAPIPRSLGAMEASAAQGGVNVGQRGDPAFDTADFDDERGPGNLRVDYVLPSIECVVMGGGVFWPGVDEPGHALVASSWSSDHRLVWVDLSIPSRFRSDRR
ncbi:MAG: endonuclease/exonuclease/phosphatase family protein, partial [Phycisphaerales bacterium]|nr:endonuclease/exonuclease/phosphatase family protein [Phycisphaerales bacterium]